MTTSNNPHIGSDFDTFLEEDGNLEAATATAIKRVIAWQIGQEMKAQHITKTAMAARMKPAAPRSTVCSTKPTRASRWRRSRARPPRSANGSASSWCPPDGREESAHDRGCAPTGDGRGGVAGGVTGNPASGSVMISPRVAASRRVPARAQLPGHWRGPATCR